MPILIFSQRDDLTFFEGAIVDDEIHYDLQALLTPRVFQVLYRYARKTQNSQTERTHKT